MTEQLSTRSCDKHFKEREQGREKKSIRSCLRLGDHKNGATHTKRGEQSRLQSHCPPRPRGRREAGMVHETDTSRVEPASSGKIVTPAGP